MMFQAVSDNVSWRQAEAGLFKVMSDMEDGWVPALRECGGEPPDLRRLGYLAEVVARFRRPANRTALLAFAEQALGVVRARLGEPLPVEAAVPGGAAARYEQKDDLARKWGVHPGVDLDRYEAETSRQPEADRAPGPGR